jgi:hypothetical protein
MKMNSWNRFGFALIALMGLLMGACNEDEPMGKGDVDFEITDAPTDDASVKGVFVTIADVKIGGKSVEGFTKQTIDIKAYQEGNTKLFASAKELDAKSYNNLTLVLDLNADANGNSPGCYVQTIDNAKYKLSSDASGMMELAIDKSWSAASNTKSTIVLDFDLRKSIKYMSDPSVKYNFVSNGELKSAIRVVSKQDAGMITGTYEESTSSNADKIIVYAYKKGTFNASSETAPQGDGQVLFANAVTSAEVKQGLTGKSFKLAMLESDEYELHFAAHKADANGRLALQALLNSETSVNGTVGNIIKVEAGATINVSAMIGGL